MHFESQDFIIRFATGSDQAEVISLFNQFALKPSGIELNTAQFQEFLKKPATNFKVALNSNGVMIGFWYCEGKEWKALALNPNFLKQSLKESLFHDLKTWALKLASSAGSECALLTPSKMIQGPFKSFFKQMGCKLDAVKGAPHQSPDECDQLIFPV